MNPFRAGQVASYTCAFRLTESLSDRLCEVGNILSHLVTHSIPCGAKVDLPGFPSLKAND